MNRFWSLVAALLFSTSLVAAPSDDVIIDLTSKGARITRSANGGALTAPSRATRPDVVRGYLAAKGSPGAKQDTLRPVGEHAGRDGVTHLRMVQEIDGLQVYGTYVKASVNARGQLVNVIDNTVGKPAAGLVPAQIGARGALEAALAHLYPESAASILAGTSTAGVSGNETRFTKGSFFFQEPSVTRVAVPFRGGALRAGYLVETWEAENNQLWHTVIDGKGAVVHQELRTSSDSYNVFADHPGVSPQTIVSGPGTGNTQSPIGWVFSNTTTGNNVDAYLDADNNNAADSGGRPVSSTQSFVTAADLTQSPTTTNNKMVAVQNLFYLNNRIHDYLREKGFTEAAGNFQEDNFGNGGLGSDSVYAEAQDGGGTNNANFATPADGSNPRMQMYIWTQTTPNRDGDLDSDIVWHEYGHGLTWRMIGSMSGALAGAIGEGNSDVLAIYSNNQDAVGEYSYNSPNGIRRYRYTNYPLTYGDVTGSSVHSDGEIYAGTMWHLKELFNAAGLSTDLLFGYMIDGMNYTPASPAYEDMRDGILSAITDPAHECLVWTAFAKFGIGVGASGTSSCRGLRCTVSITESFAVPAEYATCGAPAENVAPTANFSSSASGLTVSFTDTSSDSDGTIAARSWSFGDGTTSTATNPSKTYAAAGTYVVTLVVTDDDGATGLVTKDVTVSDAPANAAPVANFTFSTSGLTASFTDASSDSDGSIVSRSWNFGDGTTSTATNPSKSYAASGTYTVTLTVTDDGGASASTSKSVTVTAPSTGISLNVSAYKVKGVQTADLTWSGATSTSVDVYRNNVKVVTTANDGTHTDNIGAKGGGSYTYRVCEAGTSTCSASVSITF